ncbi:hypothetical protein VNI00_012649 [Paramarasmius palmivorus]|uniref:RBR-type E3 ubiquitin transferase n=1 Tax=Paramarasmius palmivorus TaxID=297713 RepID=A0AAW0C7H8_9AGAR
MSRAMALNLWTIPSRQAKTKCGWGDRCLRRHIALSQHITQELQPGDGNQNSLQESQMINTETESSSSSQCKTNLSTAKDKTPEPAERDKDEVQPSEIARSMAKEGSRVHDDHSHVRGKPLNGTMVPLEVIGDDCSILGDNTSAVLDSDELSSTCDSEWYPTTNVTAWENLSASSSSYGDTQERWYPSTDASSWDRDRSYSPVSDAPEIEDQDKKPPPPRYKTICWRWLQGRCDKEHKCFYRHGDIEYDEENSNPSHPPSPQHTHASSAHTGTAHQKTQQLPPFSQWTVPLRDHIKVRFGPGFTISDVTTGFETAWVYLSGLPASITTEQLNRVLSRYGSVQELKFYAHRPPLVSAKARFTNNREAQEAVGVLDGTRLQLGEDVIVCAGSGGVSGSVVTARLSLHVGEGHNASLQDTAVRITFEAPGKRGYAGYPTLERARKALEIVNREYTTTFISARIHVGLPAVGAHTVCFSNLPPQMKEKGMKRYAEPEGMMWENQNYRDVDDAAGGIRWLIESSTDAQAMGIEVVKFDVLPPPYRDGRVRAWAYFATPRMARDAVGLLHKRKPKCTGHSIVFAQHVQTLSYGIPVDVYNRAAQDIESLKATLWRQGKRTMTISMVRLDNLVIAKLSADDLKDLGELKAELERTLQGEVVRDDGQVIWSDFFARSDGRAFLRSLEDHFKGVTIKDDAVRRGLRLFGPKEKRNSVRLELVKKHKELRMGELRSLIVPGHLMGPFMGTQLGPLKRLLGSENVMLDMWNQKLTIRGSLVDFQAAQQSVKKVRMPHLTPGIASCPVCFGQVELPIRLSCGHTYCRACLANYLLSSKDHRFFPLSCLGDEARCSLGIPISIARDILPLGEFEAIIEAAFSVHVDAHSKEFHYCPSPDCMQVYRPAPAGTVLQCPSCLTRICPECHVEYHDGFGCPEKDGGDRLFREWMDKHGVKNCPGCKVPIERNEGCNHVTCTRCRTHICWVCLETFPKGEGIYGHMRSEHGGIGV